MQHLPISRSLFSLFALLLLLGSWSCSGDSADGGEAADHTPPAAEPETDAPTYLFVQVDDLRMREGAGMEAKVIAELPEGTRLADLGEASTEMTEVTLRGVKHKAPWMKVATEAGLVGWVFGGAVGKEAPGADSKQGSMKAYLSSLKANCEDLDKARKALRDRLRSSQNDKEKDAHVAAFYDFYSESVLNAQDLSEQPGKAADYDLLAYNPDNKPIPAHVQAQMKKWEACGVGLEFPEGMLYLNEHPDYMVKHFANLASPAMKEHLLQRQTELKEGLSEDGGLMVTPRKLAERLAFWDQFLATYPAFIYKGEIRGNQNGHVGLLMGGLDNTPAFDYVSNTLDPEWKAAYEWLMATHKTTPSGKIIKDYYMLLKKSDWKPTDESWAYVKKYRGW